MPNVVSNANIYMNGSNFVGRAKSIELPEIETTMEDFEGLGHYGTFQLPHGIEAMECTIEWQAFYPEWARLAADFTQNVNMQCRALVEEHQTTGRVATNSLIVTMRARFMTNPLGSFTQKEAAEFESTLSVSYVKQVYGSETILEYDAIANIYKVRGVDLLQGFRSSLGLGAQ